MNNRKISPLVSMKYRNPYQLPKQMAKQVPKHQKTKPIQINLKPKVTKQNKPIIDRKKEKVL